MAARGAIPERFELAGIISRSATHELGAIVDPLIDTAIRRSTTEPEGPLDPAVRSFASTCHRDGIELARLLDDYSHLRDATIAAWDEEGESSVGFLRTLSRVIDEAVMVTVQEYRMGGELLSMVCHDLRNPLQSLLLCGTQLERIESADPRIAKPAEVILRATQRLGRLIDDLALFAAMDQGSVGAATTAQDPRQLLADVVDAHRAAAQEKKVVLETKVLEPLRFVVVDKNRVLRVLHHLLQHALKMTPASGTIMLGVRTEERTSSFFVEHGGKAKRSLDLGLARALASGHGGQVLVERDGSSVSFSISG